MKKTSFLFFLLIFFPLALFSFDLKEESKKVIDRLVASGYDMNQEFRTDLYDLSYDKKNSVDCISGILYEDFPSQIACFIFRYVRESKITIKDVVAQQDICNFFYCYEDKNKYNSESLILLRNIFKEEYELDYSLLSNRMYKKKVSVAAKALYETVCYKKGVMPFEIDYESNKTEDKEKNYGDCLICKRSLGKKNKYGFFHNTCHFLIGEYLRPSLSKFYRTRFFKKKLESYFERMDKKCKDETIFEFFMKQGDREFVKLATEAFEEL